MIQSYFEEVRNRRNKNILFWIIVFVFTCFLYLFFRGYYVDINLQKYIDNKEPIAKNIIFKPFGIINIYVFPSPDKIFINGNNYTNGSKSIFDFGHYDIKIEKKGYIPINLSVNLDKNIPFYINTVNLIKNLKYYPIKDSFDEIYKVDDFYIAKIKDDSIIKILNQKMEELKILITDYTYLGYKFFSYKDIIYSYYFDDNILKPLISKETGKEMICKNAKLFNENLFCFDTMTFLNGDYTNLTEKIIKIGNDIIFTKNYLYNNDPKNNNWDYYKHENTLINNPDYLVHIENIPYVLDGGILYNLEKSKKNIFQIKELDKIIEVKEFGEEIILTGYKNNKTIFVLISGARKYIGIFDSKTDIINMKIDKINGIYTFTTKNTNYIYYKGGKNIIKILNGEILKMIDAMIFFKKDGKNYYLDLEQN